MYFKLKLKSSSLSSPIQAESADFQNSFSLSLSLSLSLSNCPYPTLLPAGLLNYILCLLRAAANIFLLVSQNLLGRLWGPIEERPL